MNGVDALRRSYSELTPKERATMFFREATTHQREEVILSLRPGTVVEALRTSKIETVMLAIAGIALTTALLSERAGCSIVAARKSGTFAKALTPHLHCWSQAAAVAVALCRLEEETGIGFLAAADLLGGGDYFRNKAAMWKDHPGADEELKTLRELWETGTRY